MGDRGRRKNRKLQKSSTGCRRRMAISYTWLRGVSAGLYRALHCFGKAAAANAGIWQGRSGGQGEEGRKEVLVQFFLSSRNPHVGHENCGQAHSLFSYRNSESYSVVLSQSLPAVVVVWPLFWYGLHCRSWHVKARGRKRNLGFRSSRLK